MRTIHMIVSGRVQGVGFRFYAYMMAKQYHIKGYVENLDDGDVGIYAQGDHENLSKFQKVIHKGAPFSRVEKVKEKEMDMKPFKDFKMCY